MFLLCEQYSWTLASHLMLIIIAMLTSERCRSNVPLLIMPYGQVIQPFISMPPLLFEVLNCLLQRIIYVDQVYITTINAPLAGNVSSSLFWWILILFAVGRLFFLNSPSTRCIVLVYREVIQSVSFVRHILPQQIILGSRVLPSLYYKYSIAGKHSILSDQCF